MDTILLYGTIDRHACDSIREVEVLEHVSCVRVSARLHMEGVSYS